MQINVDSSWIKCEICQIVLNGFEGTLLSRTKVQYADMNAIFEGFLVRTHPKSLNSGCHYNTIQNYYEIFNRVVMHHYLTELDKIVLEGSVEFDETRLFREHKTKAAHRTYESHDVWLFGLIERTTKRFILFPVSNREESTLTPIIIKYVKRRSIIYSDSFSSYVNTRTKPKRSKLSQYGFIHFFVNHSTRFVSKTNPYIHTNTIENLWGLLKREISNDGIRVHYYAAVARFFFFRTYEDIERRKILLDGIQNQNIPEMSELISILINKF
jgi:transposase-like protein